MTFAPASPARRAPVRPFMVLAAVLVSIGACTVRPAMAQQAGYVG